MASAIRSDPGTTYRNVVGAAAQMGGGSAGAAAQSARAAMEKVERLGMSPRQQQLNQYYAYYRAQQYDARRCDWDGKERLDPLSHESIGRSGLVPPGFYDASVSRLPLKFRRPSAPYHLCKVIVDRFTGLLFSERRHPKVRVEGEPITEDYSRALAEASRLWPTMIRARTLGGAMGTVAVGFQFDQGRPIVEVHDARWCTPVFSNRWQLKLSSLEVRYMYPEDLKDQETGRWETVWFWYRRIINETSDTVFKREPVGDGEEPQWQVGQEVVHGLGFCPVLWVQNLPVQDEIDGDPDCHAIYDTTETIDGLLAQANKGTLANCDPTLLLVTDAKLGEIAKGSDNAIKLPPNSTGQYLELAGSSTDAALKLVNVLRGYSLEVAQCVLEHPDVANRTATEIERTYDSMHSKADILREQYGERCVKPLLEMMIQAVRLMARPIAIDGRIVRRTVYLPPRIVEGKSIPRELPPLAAGELPTEAIKLMNLQLAWPPHVTPTHADALQASQAATTARQGKLLDLPHAAGHVAPFFGVEDVAAMVKTLQQEEQEAAEQLRQQMMSAMDDEGRTGRGGGGGGDDEQVDDEEEVRDEDGAAGDQSIPKRPDPPRRPK